MTTYTEQQVERHMIEAVRGLQAMNNGRSSLRFTTGPMGMSVYMLDDDRRKAWMIYSAACAADGWAIVNCDCGNGQYLTIPYDEALAALVAA